MVALIGLLGGLFMGGLVFACLKKLTNGRQRVDILHLD